MTDKPSEQELKIRTMFVSERLEMRLQGSPEPENGKGYTMYRNWQLRMEIADAKALEQRVERLEFAARQALMAIEEGYDAPKIRDDLRQALKETT